jgi:hypothetical protein
MTTASRAGMWLGVSALYACMFTPVYCTMKAGGVLRSAQLSLPLMLAGLALEATADEQKQAAKKTNPSGFVSSGMWHRLTAVPADGDWLLLAPACRTACACGQSAY